MKKIFFIISAFSVAVFSSGCLKDKPNTDFSGLQPIIEISNASNNPVTNAPSSGLAYFGSATLFLAGADDPDTISFTVNMASAYPLKKDVSYTLEVDADALASLNADSTINSARIDYAPFPTDEYEISKTSGVIKAGTRLDTIYVIFHPNKIDFTKSYALPISIKTADGVTISANTGTIYFHQIGNPIAGSYTWDFQRIPTMDGSGSPDGQSFTGHTGIFVPVDATTVDITTGYVFPAAQYQLTFDDDGAGHLTNFQISLTDATVSYLKDNGLTVISAPKIITADPATRTYKFQWTAFNGSAYRYNVDSFHP
jgi:hypothetical protein